MAVVVRPNLAPLVVFPLILTLVHGGARRSLMTRASVFCMCVAPFAVFIALVHQFLYGSPLTSGYGDLSTIFSLRNFSANARAYPLWWWQTQGPIGWLFIIGVFRPRSAETRWRILTTVAFAVAVVFSYVFYLPFAHWGFLRFVLSAAPVALLLAADAVFWLSSRFGRPLAAIVLAAVSLLSAARSFDLVRRENVFGSAAGEQRYADAGLYVNTATPRKSVIVAMQHSGSVRYYSGRIVLRYDLLDPAWLDRALDTLANRGFSIYALLEEWEEVNFRSRFAAQQSTRTLDAGPRAAARAEGRTVRFFALRSDDAPSGGPPVTIPHISATDCPGPSPYFSAPITK
jgi:hypothetical protein